MLTCVEVCFADRRALSSLKSPNAKRWMRPREKGGLSAAETSLVAPVKVPLL
jgi:hypothetical protein